MIDAVTSTGARTELDPHKHVLMTRHPAITKFRQISSVTQPADQRYLKLANEPHLKDDQRYLMQN